MIIIPIKWLFHWEYTQHFQTNPDCRWWIRLVWGIWKHALDNAVICSETKSKKYGQCDGKNAEDGNAEFSETKIFRNPKVFTIQNLQKPKVQIAKSSDVISFRALFFLHSPPFGWLKKTKHRRYLRIFATKKVRWGNKTLMKGKEKICGRWWPSNLR